MYSVIARQAAYLGSTVLVRIVMQSGSTLSILLMAKFLGQEAVATYSVCLAAIWLSSIVFGNGVPVMMRRHLVLHPDMPALTIYRRSQSAVFRSPRRYLLSGTLLSCLAVYIGATTGVRGVILLMLMSPLTLMLAVLALKIEYHRAIGQAIAASVFEPGLLHILIAVLISFAVWISVTDLISIFSVGALGFLAGAVYSVSRLLRKTVGENALENSAAQQQILATNLLLFVFRNGFPLFFAGFMIAADLGHFRTEERLFFLLLFFYMLYETLGMKSIIAAFRSEDSAERSRFYRRSVLHIFGIGMLSAVVMYAGLSNATLARIVGYELQGSLLLCMALATPFYFVTYFNNMVLNLVGRHSAVIWSLLSGSIAFIAGAYLLYPWLGTDGARMAYMCGGIVSSCLSGATLLMAQRNDRPGPDRRTRNRA